MDDPLLQIRPRQLVRLITPNWPDEDKTLIKQKFQVKLKNTRSLFQVTQAATRTVLNSIFRVHLSSLLLRLSIIPQVLDS